MGGELWRGGVLEGGVCVCHFLGQPIGKCTKSQTAGKQTDR